MQQSCSFSQVRKPQLLPLARPQGAPTTPPQVNTFVPFLPMAQKDPLTNDHRQKEQTVNNLQSGIVSLLAKQSFAD